LSCREARRTLTIDGKLKDCQWVLFCSVLQLQHLGVHNLEAIASDILCRSTWNCDGIKMRTMVKSLNRYCQVVIHFAIHKSIDGLKSYPLQKDYSEIHKEDLKILLDYKL
jgi:hypothetical protein